MLLDSLTESLQVTGAARLGVNADRTVRDCRKLLIQAAQAIDVRIEMHRHGKGEGEYVDATVLSPEEAQRQIDRDNLFRAVNDIKAIAGEVKHEAHRLDLIDIADELEDYARKIKISGGAAGDSPFTPRAVPASDTPEST